MALNASHAGWYHFAPFNRHFATRRVRRGPAKAARRVNIAGFHWMHLAIAAAAGHLGLPRRDGLRSRPWWRRAAPGRRREPARVGDALVLGRGVRSSLVSRASRGARSGRLEHNRASAASGQSARQPRQHQSRPMPRSAAATAPSTWIAVMPFAAGHDEESQSLADGLTEDVTAGLARFPYLSVVAAHSARQHKGSTADVRQLGQALGARYLARRQHPAAPAAPCASSLVSSTP